MKRAVFLPDYRKGNPYQELLAESLATEGWNVDIQNYPAGLFPLNSVAKKYRNADVIHIHWIPPLIAKVMWAKSTPIFIFKLLLLWVDIQLMKLRGKKLVWTIHNKFSHQQYDHRRERIIRKCLVKWVDTAITHGEKATKVITQAYGLTAKPKVVSILHGNYEGRYPPPNISKAVFKESLNIPADSTLIFCFGMLRAYKGIENVLEAVRQVNSDKVALYIAGEVQDKAYASKLIDMKADIPNVIIKFEFLNDQELANSLFAADVVACPFSSTLTSGSVILAMTQGKALILPESAKALDSITPDGILTYTCQDELTNLIMKLDNEKLEEMGRINKHRAETFNWKMVGEQTVKAYSK